jgi:DNA-binding NarL/FixJ family response regulator
MKAPARPAPARRARVLLADDHTLVAEGLASLLEDEFDLVGQVRDGRALVDAVRRLAPDVVVTDISMPLLNGLDAVRQLRREGLPGRIVVLTMHADVHLAAETLRAGATGYVLKQDAGEELIAAIHEVLRGHTYVTPLLAEGVHTALAADRAAGGRGIVGLSPRQREVLQLVAEGRTMKEIAAILGISTRTAESHKYQMMNVLGLATTAELVQYAIRVGVISVTSAVDEPARRSDRWRPAR